MPVPASETAPYVYARRQHEIEPRWARKPIMLVCAWLRFVSLYIVSGLVQILAFVVARPVLRWSIFALCAMILVWQTVELTSMQPLAFFC